MSKYPGGNAEGYERNEELGMRNGNFKKSLK